MHSGTGLKGLVRVAAGVLACLVVAGVPAVMAADGAPNGQSAAAPPASPQSTAVGAAPADGGAPATTDDAPPPDFLHSIEVYGFVDGYYGWAFNETNPQLRNFDVNHNNFSLNYVELALAKPATDKSRAGFRVDFGAGDTADLVNAFEPGGTGYLKYVQQAYVSVLAPVGKGGLTVDFGKFVTPAGAEVIENKDNFNYSRGLLFALAIPYYHMGARVGYSFSDKVSVTGYLVNGWNDVKDNNGAKTVGASLAFKPGKATIIANYLVGDEQPEGSDGGTRNLIDLVATLPLGEKSSFLINYDYAHDKVAGDGVNWSGIAVGMKFQLNDKFALSPRYEYFADSDGFATGTDQNLQEFTLTGEVKMPSGLLARVEFRDDFSDKHFFTKDSGALSKTQPTLTFALIYAFSTK